MQIIKKIDVLSGILILSLLALDILVWHTIVALKDGGPARAYPGFVVFSGNVTMMIDAGSDNKILDTLGKLVPSDVPYIDLAIISGPQFKDFNGYNYVLDHYRVGAFIYNGRADNAYFKAWLALVQKISAKHIPIITLGAGDRIRYKDSEINFLSPNKEFVASPDQADIELVEIVKTAKWTKVFPSNIGPNVRNFLREGGYLL